MAKKIKEVLLPRRITQKQLARNFKDIKKQKNTESRFCFLLGAGASKSSGIKTGWELAQKWYDELAEDLTDEEFKRWEQSLDGFHIDKLGEFYTQIYGKRYESDPSIGYEEFKRMMETIEPGLGYAVLSQILTREKHNFVITTNFDYLVEDAVRTFTSKKPFSAGHETLAEFVSLQTERPTIIKVHRDLFLQPFNDEAGTQKLKEQWGKALLPIVKNFNLLVIGYGGNDGSLMDYLRDIDPNDRKAIYWCTRKVDTLNNKINALLTPKDYIVTIGGFDELMYGLHDVLEYEIFKNLDTPDEHPFVQETKARIAGLNEKRRQLLEKVKDPKQEITDEVKEVFTGAMKYLVDAYEEEDIGKKEVIFKNGLDEYPNDASLNNDYANFLYTIKNYDEAEKYYKKSIGLDSENAIINGNYALFLEKNKDYDQAERYYTKALELDPENAINNGNYALFLENVNDYDNAEKYHKRAIELDTEQADFLGNYALFLENIRKDNDEAEKYYKKALELDPRHSNNIGNYAFFLNTVRKEYDEAERYYKKALELDSKKMNTIGHYAVFLENIRKDYTEAEKYYSKSIELDNTNVNYLGNYALFLERVKKDYSGAEAYYKKALELDPDHPINTANYAHHLILSKQDFKEAEKYINIAFELVKKEPLDVLVELWFYRYAHYPEWRVQAAKELESLFEKGAKSVGWNFDPHIEIAKENGHPNPEKLKEFADRISSMEEA